MVRRGILAMRHPIGLVLLLATLLAVSACSGSGVEPSSLRPLTSEESNAGQFPAPGPVGGAGTASGNSATQPRVASINSNARVRFAPAIGVSAEAVPALAARLRVRSEQIGLAVAGSSDPSTTHVMKGYFSAFTDKNETTVIYVWDVLDPAGNRVHRIQGQQKETSRGDGWSAVTASTMEAIADRTIDELAVWLSSAAG